MYLLILLAIFCLIALAVIAVFAVRFWRSRYLHQRCVRLCRCIADELSKKQEPELVTERIFRVVINHTNAAIGVLSFFSNNDEQLQLSQFHGLPDGWLKVGSMLDKESAWNCHGALNVEKPIIRNISTVLTDALWTKAQIKIDPHQNMICIPIFGPGDIHGILQLVSSPDLPFTKQHCDDLAGVGFYLGAAVHNARLIDAISRQRDAAEILYEIGLNISRFLELDSIINYAVEQGHRLLASDLTWYLDSVDEEQTGFRIRKYTGMVGDSFHTGDFIRASGTVSELSHASATSEGPSYIYFGNIHGTDPADLFCDQNVYEKFRILGIHSALVVAVGEETNSKGLLCSFSRKADCFNDFDINLLQRLANQVLIALNTTELHTIRQDIAVSTERERLSNELHDNMAQVINGVSLELHSLATRGRRLKVDADLLERIDRVGIRIQDAKAKIRQSIFELQMPKATDLWENLSNFIHSFERWHELEISMELPDQNLEQPVERQREVVRIVQEMLWNIRKHSGVSQASLRGNYNASSDVIKVEVADTGKGAETDQLNRGQGIMTMRSRAGRLGGSLAIATRPQQGLSISLEFPASG